MNRYFELITQFEKELRLRKYANNTIETYKSCLGLFLKAMNGKPKPLPLDCIKDFLLTIKNANYHKQFNATISKFIGHYNVTTTSDFYLRLAQKSLGNRIAEADILINQILISKNHPLLIAI